MKFVDVIAEATTTTDVTGTKEPNLIDWAVKKKKDKIVRRQLNKIEKV